MLAALSVFCASGSGFAASFAPVAPFRTATRIGREPAEWIVHGPFGMVSGSDGRVVLADGRTLEFTHRVSSAAAIGHRLFLAGNNGALVAIDLTRTGAEPTPFELSPPARGALHIAAMEGALVIAEDGFGIRVLPFGCAGHAAHRVEAEGEPKATAGVLPLRERVGAVCARGRTIRAAVPGRGIIEIDARDPASPRIVRQVAGPGDAIAMADDGVRLFTLGPRGLSVETLVDQSSSRQEHPEVHGTGLSLAGRRVLVADGTNGVVSWIDTTLAPLLVGVSVENNFFAPGALTVNVGDTVRWTNVSGHLHNVFSCTADQVGCNGIAAQESFSSGAASAFFVDEFTFSQPGSNPYICQPHAPFMVGSIEVVGTPTGPPTVPDGVAGTAMTVTRLAADVSVLAIHWDTATCTGAADHQVVFGRASQLPGSTGGTFALDGAVCAIGTDSPITWENVPQVVPGGNDWLFWLVVATDGSLTEGAWGRDSAGVERAGPGGSGSSGQCGVTGKDLSSTCGQ